MAAPGKRFRVGSSKPPLSARASWINKPDDRARPSYFYLELQKELIIKQNAGEHPGNMTVIEYDELKYPK